MKKEIRITIINQQILITFRILILRRLPCFNKNCSTSSTIYSLSGRSVVTTGSHYERDDLFFCSLLISPESDSLILTMYDLIPKGSCVVRNTNLLRRERFRVQAWPKIPTANKSLSQYYKATGWYNPSKTLEIFQWSRERRIPLPIKPNLLSYLMLHRLNTYISQLLFRLLPFHSGTNRANTYRWVVLFISYSQKAAIITIATAYSGLYSLGVNGGNKSDIWRMEMRPTITK